jgi:hypothetical protein
MKLAVLAASMLLLACTQEDLKNSAAASAASLCREARNCTVHNEAGPQ